MDTATHLLDALRATGIGQILVKQRLDIRGWSGRALCRFERCEPNDFFPTRHATPVMVKRAKAVCERCPVRAECLAQSLISWEPVGIWGGKTEIERRRIRRLAIDQSVMVWMRERPAGTDERSMFRGLVTWLKSQTISDLGRRPSTRRPRSIVAGGMEVAPAVGRDEHEPGKVDVIQHQTAVGA